MSLHARIARLRIEGAEILHGIELRLQPGAWTAIVGPNGAGKSSLLRVLAGLLKPEGEVQLQGRALGHWPAAERARQLAWMGPQEPGADDLTAHDVVMLGRLPHRAWLAPPSAADHAAVEAAMQALQCWPWRHRRLASLSSGERQRVLLARVLAVQAAVTLLDEPLAHLDPPHQAEWQSGVRDLVLQGRTVVSVLHELNIALAADQLVVMDAGRIVSHASTRQKHFFALLQLPSRLTHSVTSTIGIKTADCLSFSRFARWQLRFLG
jgi:iron complex transport system ATP-binding protein